MIGKLVVSLLIGASAQTQNPATLPEYLNCSQIGQLWISDGGPYASEHTAEQVAMAESGGNTTAFNADSNGTTDNGLFQINSSHGDADLDDPSVNTQDAIAISDNGNDWYPWSTYESGAYASYCSGSAPVAPIPVAPVQQIPVSVPPVRPQRVLPIPDYRAAHYLRYPDSLPIEQTASIRLATDERVPHKDGGGSDIGYVVGGSVAGIGIVAGLTKIESSLMKGSLGMTRTMFDSTTIQDIPADAQMVCYYPHDPEFDPTTAQLDRFNPENTVLLKIDNDGNFPKDCQILDVETGAATLADAPKWLQDYDASPRATFYCNASTLPALVRVIKAVAPNPSHEYVFWVAEWDGKADEYSYEGITVVAKQYAAPGYGVPNDGNHNYDLSVVWDDSWHPQPAPKETSAPDPAPAPTETPSTTVAGIITYVKNGNLALARVSSEDEKTWVQH
jgi:hypothetical protein